MKSPPIRERHFHGDLYDEDRNVEKRGLQIVVSTTVRTDTGRYTAAVEVKQLDHVLKPESSVLVGGLDAHQIRNLGLLLIEAANCIKYDVEHAQQKSNAEMMKMFGDAIRSDK